MEFICGKCIYRKEDEDANCFNKRKVFRCYYPLNNGAGYRVGKKARCYLVHPSLCFTPKNDPTTDTIQNG